MGDGYDQNLPGLPPADRPHRSARSQPGHARRNVVPAPVAWRLRTGAVGGEEETEGGVTIDPDLLSIRRKRRQEKRCLFCGVPCPRAALCAYCRQTLRYCPRCEALWHIKRISPSDAARGRSTLYCRWCANVQVNGRRLRRPDYLATLRERQHPRLSAIKRLYRQGLTYPQIAAALDMNRGTLGGIIAHARRTGRWPAALRRRV